ncbi:MAG: conditioned medium-induced protein 4 [Halobacteriaceae archaeon]
MKEKTEELRDIFMDVTDEETVTERQAETHGSLASEEDVAEQLHAVVAEMHSKLDFGTSLSTDELVTVVRGYYDGKSDTAIARDLGDASLSKTVARARQELHLLRDSDRDPPFDFEAFREAVDDESTASTLADRFDVSESTIRRYRRVVEAQQEMRRLNNRYVDEFDRLLEDADLSERHTATDDGLEDATEGQETDMSL